MNTRVEELKRWGNRIEEAVHDLGLDIYPQEFECVYDQESFLALVSHQALDPVFRSHHFGREFDKLKTMSEWGMQRYAEVAVNIHPCRAYLLMTNPLPLQIIVMAHVYAHNNVFKVNERLNSANPDNILTLLKNDATLIQDIKSREEVDPNIIDSVLDAARYIKWHKQRTDYDCFEEDILQSIEKEAPLNDNERATVKAVRRWSDYLYQQMMTKLINEGWATFIEWEILKRVNEIEPLPSDLYNECLEQHLKLIGTPGRWTRFISRPSPYFLGYHICKFWTEKLGGIQKASERLTDMDDDKLINDYWHPDFEEEIIEKIDNNVVQDLDDMDAEELQQEQRVRTMVEKVGLRPLIRSSFGSAQIPWVVRINSKDEGSSENLEMRHIFLGRELDFQLAREAVEAVRNYLWKVDNGSVVLYTRVEVPVESEGDEDKTEHHFAKIESDGEKTDIEISRTAFDAISI